MATIKELLNTSVEKLEAMTTEELLAYCKPFLVYATLNPQAKEDDDQPELPSSGGVVNLNSVGERHGRPRKGRTKKGETWQQEALKLAARLNLVVNPDGTIELPKDLNK